MAAYHRDHGQQSRDNLYRRDEAFISKATNVTTANNHELIPQHHRQLWPTTDHGIFDVTHTSHGLPLKKEGFFCSPENPTPAAGKVAGDGGGRRPWLPAWWWSATGHGQAKNKLEAY
ncbi:uncharacterized protein G2W53_040063 [Senna tora]|uniref:Uncharacterized protein n=1 Tax=Senna tora TaxID=362788 RepID=A0A834SUB4_9FABA|nr:uncharacterized protein G2W53_040045 [Senna tora]KAF7807902.1 uncharacterized protein G2W53_040063 [Senna tora]